MSLRLEPTLPHLLDDLPRLLSSWRSYPTFDDMLQEARLGAWRAWEAFPHLPEDRRHRIARAHAFKTAYSFLKSPRNTVRRATGEILEEVAFSNWDGILPEYPMTVPDPAPAIISRLYTEHVIEATAENEEERWILRRIICDGWTDADIALAKGRNARFVCRLRRAFRARHGVRSVERRALPNIFRYRQGNCSGWRVRMVVERGGKLRSFGLYPTQEEACLVADAVKIAYGLKNGPLFLLPERLRDKNDP